MADLEGGPGGVHLWQLASQYDEIEPLSAPSSHSSPGSMCPSPHRGGVGVHQVQSVVQLD